MGVSPPGPPGAFCSGLGGVVCPAVERNTARERDHDPVAHGDSAQSIAIAFPVVAVAGSVALERLLIALAPEVR